MDNAQYEKRMAWFREARFGMFIHYGLYAIAARGEWVKSNEQISTADYQKYFDAFTAVDYDPREWARLCKAAGMKYAVLTAKHHDGFCLFDSALTDYKSTNAPCKRDLIREYVDAFRAEGLGVGLYYSLIDWHHEDYPHYQHPTHPMREKEEYKDKEHNFDRYLEYMHGQIRELCTNYGQIDLFWFDFSYGEMSGEKWRATELVNMIRSYQPDVIMDNRMEVSGSGFGSLVTGNRTVYSGDYVSPEMMIPPKPIVDHEGNPVYWESCLTINNNWGYAAFDYDYKAPETVIRFLVECVSKGGNLLLNVAPDARGNMPEQAWEILEDVGFWLGPNGEGVYGCGYAGNIETPEGCMATSDGKNIYLHIFAQTPGPAFIKGIKREDIQMATLLYSGAELFPVRTFVTENYPEYVFFAYGPNPHFSYPLPDPLGIVIKIALK
ncbi:MAG: alpha-L-fucosidase [Oscillospiraceae bacterium]|nr:alpha-L-fucosidase [Oscillospiraceae bacterium]